MNLLKWIAKPYAWHVVKKTQAMHQNANDLQNNLLFSLLQQAKDTDIGVEFGFKKIDTIQAYKAQLPLIEYEDIEAYMNRIKAREKNILWPGLPLYLSKTSGTTSGVKYIPITAQSIRHHIRAARNSLLYYINRNNNSDFINGKMIFLQGSPRLETINGIETGRLSGIVYHHVPAYLHKNRMPAYETNCIDNWEDKVARIAAETLNENMTLISGIPPWLIMYFEKLIQLSGKKTVKEIFPNLQLMVYGGVNYQPYQKQIDALIGEKIFCIETYPASEGFIAFSDLDTEKGLLLNLDAGIYYEFIEADKSISANTETLSIAEVELHKNYSIVITSDAGLWRYLIGDTIRFVSLNPYRMVITGRTKQFLSAFGEHVITEEVENAIQKVCYDLNSTVAAFTVAPNFGDESGLPFHEWFIEFEKLPDNRELFAKKLDIEMQNRNIYYKDLVQGKVLQPLRINFLPKKTFYDFYNRIGKLGGQNKVLRLSNNRDYVEQLIRATI